MWGSLHREGYATAVRRMTMSHLMSRSVTLTTSPRTCKLNLSIFSRANTLRIPSAFTSRNMNTLQEASKVYKSFQKGGPSFGAWQVRLSTSQTVIRELMYTSSDAPRYQPCSRDSSLRSRLGLCRHGAWQYCWYGTHTPGLLRNSLILA
jgi:hypothetical protein